MDPNVLPVADQPAAAAPQTTASIRAGQNFPLAMVAGLAAAIVGAVLWAVVTVMSHMQLGIVSIGVGLLIGYAIRETGKGMDDRFRYLGAACAIVGCALGAVLVDVGLLAQRDHVPVMEVIHALNPKATVMLVKAFFKPMDLLFYAIAIYEAFKVSRKWKLRS